MIIAAVLGFLALIVALLFFFQAKLIYFPGKYEPIVLKNLPAGTVRLESAAPAGRLVAYYLAPPDRRVSAAPDRLWVLFGGNGSLALDWADLIAATRRDSPSDGFLLIDYPGYGECAGRPSRRSIAQAAEQAYKGLADHLKVKSSELESRTSVLGHSLGSAIALDFVSRHPVRRVVLISPFTSLMEMARGVVGWPLCVLLRDRFDSRARLDELARRSPRPAVTILHGDHDDVVPVRMGRELAQRHPGWIAYKEIPGGDHNFMLAASEPQILAAMHK